MKRKSKMIYEDRGKEEEKDVKERKRSKEREKKKALR